MRRSLRFKKSIRYLYWMATLVVTSFLVGNLFVFLRDFGNGSSDNDLAFPIMKRTINATNDADFCDSLPLRSVSFHPQYFMLHGPGMSYLENYKSQLQPYSKRNRRRLLKMRFLVYNISSSCRPIYYHLHKNGGSTMNIVNKDMGESSTLQASRVDAYYTPREQQLGSEKFQNATMAIWHQISKDQQEQEKRIMPIFTFLRDPVPRFLSSVGQALKLNNLGPCIEHVRAKRDTLQLLNCVLLEIEQTKRFLDEHLEPQIFELYHGTMGMDLNIYLMDLKESMDMVLQDLFGVPSQQLSRRQSKGLLLGFNLSMAVLTPEVISRICAVYSMDVLFLLQTRVTSTICENYLSVAVNKSYDGMVGYKS